MDQTYDTLYNAMASDAQVKAISNINFIFQRKANNETFDMLRTKIEQGLDATGIDAKSLPRSALEYLSYVVTKAGPRSQEELVCEIKKTNTGDITFQNVVGQEELKAEMQLNYIYPIRYTGLFQDDGSKSVMLYGVPGTGKTFIVKAATNAVPYASFFAPTTGQLLGKYLGDVEKKIDLLFKCAAQELKKANVMNSIIFLDEFDTIAGLKTDDKSMARSVNALLQAMDGVTSNKGVSVIAATNYPWKIESAVLRRFSNLVFVDLVEAPAMLQIMEMAIANNYALPNMPKTMRYETMKKNVYEYIHQYGIGLCENVKIPKKIKGYTGTYTEETPGRLVTREILIEIIRTQLGMNSYAINIKNTILNSDSPRRIMMNDFTATTTPIFGYSPSDISKVMQIAIKNASRRALMGKFKKIHIENVEWYISATDGTFKINQIPPQHQQNAYNFSLCEHDIEFAISSYKPTVKPQDYMDLLRYKKWRLAPEEDDIA